jgi:hypothetical protein
MAKVCLWGSMFTLERKDSRAPSHPKAGHCPGVPMHCAFYPVEVPIGQRTGLSRGLLARDWVPTQVVFVYCSCWALTVHLPLGALLFCLLQGL